MHALCFDPVEPSSRFFPFATFFFLGKTKVFFHALVPMAAGTYIKNSSWAQSLCDCYAVPQRLSEGPNAAVHAEKL